MHLGHCADPGHARPRGPAECAVPDRHRAGPATLALGKGATQLNTALAEALAGDLAPALVELQVRAEADWPGLGEQLGCTLTSSPAATRAGPC